MYWKMVNRGIALILAALCAEFVGLWVVVSIPLAILGAVGSVVHWVFTAGDPLVP